MVEKVEIYEVLKGFQLVGVVNDHGDQLVGFQVVRDIDSGNIFIRGLIQYSDDGSFESCNMTKGSLLDKFGVDIMSDKFRLYHLSII